MGNWNTSDVNANSSLTTTYQFLDAGLGCSKFDELLSLLGPEEIFIAHLHLHHSWHSEYWSSPSRTCTMWSSRDWFDSCDRTVNQILSEEKLNIYMSWQDNTRMPALVTGGPASEILSLFPNALGTWKLRILSNWIQSNVDKNVETKRVICSLGSVLCLFNQCTY